MSRVHKIYIPLQISRSAAAPEAGDPWPNDSQRQMVAETFVMLGMFVAAGYEQSGNKAEARAAFVELAESSFRSLTGMDVRSVTLTASGMRVR